jgi:hypothetical protein
VDLELANSRIREETLTKQESTESSGQLAFTSLCASAFENEGLVIGFELLEDSKSNEPMALAINADDPTFPVTVVFAKFVVADSPTQISRTEMNSWISDSYDLVLGNTSKAKKAMNAINEIISSHSQGSSKTRMLFLTNYLIANERGATQTVSADDFEVEIHGLESLAELIDGSRAIRSDLVVKLTGKESQAVVSVGPFGDKKSSYETYLAVFPARVLVEMYSNHGQTLIERNVRSFLQLRNKINAEMLRTISANPEMFLPYNNGLAITATNIKTKKLPSGQQAIVELVNPQIVNGGQTTAVLYEAATKMNYPLADVMVQAKVTIVSDPDEADRLTPLISQFANSQTAVKKTAFASKDEFHVKLTKTSELTPFQNSEGEWVYFYYEAKEGDYDQRMNLLRSDAKEAFINFHPRENKINKLELGTYLNAWSQLPHQVSKGEGLNFAHFQQQKDALKLQTSTSAWRQYVAKAILFREADLIIHNLSLGAYKRMTVAYTVAIISNRRNQLLNWTYIQENLKLPDSLIEEIRQIAPQVRNFIIRAAQNSNILSYAKSEECWNQLKRDMVGLKVAISNMPSQRSIDSYLVDNTYLRDLESWTFLNKVGDSKMRLACRKLLENNRFRRPSHVTTLRSVQNLLEQAWAAGYKK